MVEILLTKGKVAIIDDQDGPLVTRYKWYAIWNKGTWYARTSLPRVNGIQKHISMHRLILKATPGQQVDHRDGEGLNNRRSNLRTATQSQNNFNRRRLRHSKTSRFKGVCFNPRSRLNKWYAQIKKHGRVIYLGVFTHEQDAAQAYDRAAATLFGDFVAPN